MSNLTQQYELRECLWNVMSKDYKNQNKKLARQEISFHIGTDVDIVEKKMKSLLAQYRREKEKKLTPRRRSDADDIKVPNGLLIKGSYFFMESTSQEKQENRK
jgi:hypothetical protein